MKENSVALNLISLIPLKDSAKTLKAFSDKFTFLSPKRKIFLYVNK